MLKRFSVFLAVLAMLLAAPLSAAPASAQGLAAGSTDWTGFYAGVWGGYHAGMIDNTSCGGTCDDNIPLNGGVVGINAGYDMMYDEDWLIGGFVTLPLTKPTATSSIFSAKVSPNWATAAGVRIGRPMDNFLPYALVGVAVANVTVSGGATSSTATHFGGVLGAGLEFEIMDNLSLDTRYTLGLLAPATYNPFCSSPAACYSDYNEISHNFSVGLNYKFN